MKELLHLARRAAQVAVREGLPGLRARFRARRERMASGADYGRWAAAEAQRIAGASAEYAERIGRMRSRPVISLLMPTYNSNDAWLREAIDSVIAQFYPHWELCIADDASTDPSVRALLEDYCTRDARIKVAYRDSNGHISAATNSALALASGEYVSLIDHDDRIAPHALAELAARIADDPALDLVYSDEDKLDARGQRCDPFFKPDWSPDYLESCNYTAHLAIYRRAVAERIGGFRTAFDGAQDYDFILRFTEQTQAIGHVAEVLYHWRAIPGSTASSMDDKRYVSAAAVRALKERLQRTGRTGRARESRLAACFDLRWAPPSQPLVSIVVPTAGADRQVRGRTVSLLANCLQSIRQRTSYANYEIVVVDNSDLPEALAREVSECGGRTVHFTEPEFNISRKINLGAAAARGDFLLLLNDDVEVIARDWIEAMLEQGLKHGVGAVGAKLLYEDGRLQHVGVAHHEGLPDHVRKHYAREDPGYMFSTAAVRNYLAVTGACMLTRADLFRAAGGFEERFRVNYSDIDYCMKLRRMGLRVVYTPHAELFHFESASRKAEVAPQEIVLYRERWQARAARDPYYNSDYFRTSPPDFRLGGRISGS